MPVVVAVDRSSFASTLVEAGDALARALDETIHVVHVVDREEFLSVEDAADQHGSRAGMDAVRDAGTRIAAAATDSLSIEYVAVGLVGSPPKEIVRYATKEAASYLVIGGRKRSPTGKAIFGSTTQDILLNATQPVLTVMQS